MGVQEMAGGKWSVLDTINPAQRSGFYINFIADAVAGVQAGATGVVAIPVTAPWGPVGKIVSIATEKELRDTFSTKNEGNAYKQIRDALKNGRLVLAYRMALNAKVAFVQLDDGAGTPLVKVEAKFPGSFGNDLSVTISPALGNPSAKEFKVMMGSQVLEKVTFDGTASGLVEAAAGLAYVTVSLMSDGVLADVAGLALSGGDSGITGITVEQYATALEAFEGRAYEWNVLALPVADETFAINTAVADYIKRLRDEGYYVIAVMGHAKNGDFEEAKNRARQLNHEGIIYHYIGAIDGGVTYTPAEMTGLVAGVIAGAGAERSVTYAELPGIELVNVLTNTQIKEANAAGLLVAFYDGETNRIEKGINTLTRYAEHQHEGYSKIKVIATLDAIGNALTRSANRNYVGKVLNDDEGQQALVGAIKDALEVFRKGRMIKDGYTAQIDPDFPPVGDQCFVSIAITPVDSMDEIYGTIRVGR